MLGLPVLEPHFVVDTRHHGQGPIVFSWHPQGTCVATTGSSRVVHIFGSNGQVIDQIVPPSPSICTALDWDRVGEVLAVIQAGSSALILWTLSTRKVELVETGVKDVTWMKWSPTGDELALGTGRGTLILYNRRTGDKVTAGAGKHKRRITCGDWSEDGSCLVVGSEDRLITICTRTGHIIDHVKLSCRPVGVSFGGASSPASPDTDEAENKTIEGEKAGSGCASLVSVNMEGRTILLYHLNERENALELQFQPRYGAIVAYRWFGDGYIMAGFSLGYVVVISTRPHEIGREQFCARFHSGELGDLVYSPDTGFLASCGDGCVKLIEMDDWRELQTEEVDREVSSSSPPQLDHLAWADNGRLLSVSSRSGNLYTFAIRAAESTSPEALAPPTLIKAMAPLSPWAMAASLLSATCLVALTAGSWVAGLSVVDLTRILAGGLDGV